MHYKNITAALLTGSVAFVVSMGITAPAQAVVAAGTAYIIEGDGVYTLVNNSAFYAYQFFVTNPAADHGGATASTTLAGWHSTVCSGVCLGNGGGFAYISGQNGTDIAPGGSSNEFLFNAAPASLYTIYLHDKSGKNSSSVSGTAQAGTVPEPATWALLTVGLGAAGTALRRRRSNAMSGVTA